MECLKILPLSFLVFILTYTDIGWVFKCDRLKYSIKHLNKCLDEI
nr:MAG TPA: hypothetical protein [Caudoviricetes sp.]